MSAAGRMILGARRLSAFGALLAVCAAAAGAPAPAPKDLVTVEAKTERRAAGAVLLVNARVASGWHVNSHTPSEDYLIPTAVSVAPAPGLRAGEAKYPAGGMKKFSFAESPSPFMRGISLSRSP